MPWALDSDFSDDESEEVDDAVMDCNSDNLMKTGYHSDDENVVNNLNSEVNWLQEADQLCEEKKSILFGSHLKQLFKVDCRLYRLRRLCRLVAFFKVNFYLLYFLGLFTFCCVKMPWPAAWHWVLKKINVPQ